MISMKSIKEHSIRRQRGLSLIETAAVLGVASALLAHFATVQGDSAETMKAKAMAERLIEVQYGAASYIRANNATLLANLTTSPTVIPATGTGTFVGGLKSLQGAGVLPPSFVDKNGYNQGHVLIVRKVSSPSGDKIEGIVTTAQPMGGGWSSTGTMNDRVLAKAAQFVGASGGYVPAKPLNSDDAGHIVGMGGGWRSKAADWGTSGAAPRAGVSLVATLAYMEGTAMADYLYRTDIGVPEANRMHTQIDMNNNNIKDAKDVTAKGTISADGNIASKKDVTAGGNVTADGYLATDQSVYATQNVQAGGNVSSGATVSGINIWASQSIEGHDVTARGNMTANGTVTAGWGVTTNNGNINAANGQLTSRHGVTTQGGVWAEGNIYTNANIQGASVTTYDVQTQTLTAGGRITADELRLASDAVAGQSCSPRGLVQSDNKGNLLTCMGGKWTMPSGFTGKYKDLGIIGGNYTDVNDTGSTIIVTAFNGGYPGFNVCHLEGKVQGITRAMDADANNSLWKQCAITFPVGPGQSWQVYSAFGNIDLSYYY
ncbi:hypothetical protein BB934_45585 (plasmid) [Microvirga ossetica]|uniref:Bacterial shufflon protein N-terminal domain-containing protein n=1 Tax=Microvirga ossetica TaxID=1882682 RepID=A0A1B2EZS5_9HYPH|nr:shufflon system plasmid conjugative transfer pilus tip adhesin PilV [Microvirga ossetica]ANY85495.1 hypothetical protein BB934_45585 [Microvirga ossetica]